MHKRTGNANIQEPGPSTNAPGALVTVKKNGRKRVEYVQCDDYKFGDPLFNVFGNITGMADKKSPVSNMKMYYMTKRGGPPELNFDIDLKKECGEDEKYVLSTEPSAKEMQRRMLEKLNRIECDLEDVVNKMQFIRKLRREWNYKKADLCNRNLKDKPICYASDFGKPK